MLYQWQKGRNVALASILRKPILVFVDDRNEDRVLSCDPIVIMHAHRSKDFAFAFKRTTIYRESLVRFQI